MSTARFPPSRPESESLISAVTQHFTPIWCTMQPL